MGVVTLTSNTVTGVDSTPQVLKGPYQNRGPIHRSWERMAKASTDSTNSTYRILRVHSSMLLSSLGLLTDAWGTSGSVDIGLYDIPSVNGGAVVVAGQEFAASLDVSAAITAKKELANISQAAMTQRIWERLSLTADPNKHYDIVVKAVNIGAAQLANFFMSVDYQR